ncbi:MAG: response regulator [Candidatus Thermoplasmatota archaeon]|nr:response regulator [Candidatus Thermoplasmatota archaeon]
MAKKILVVDDNPDIIIAVKNGLESISSDYEVVGAESGMKCLEMLRTDNPDLVLLDIMMPEMSGWETFDKIKGNKKSGNIPVIFLTARTDNVAKKAGGFLGDDYIEKPFKIDELKNRIEHVLRK